MAHVIAYWMPGCSSCLRMKEFLQKSGVPFVPVNIDADPAAQAKLAKLGLFLPVACVGDECVNGVDLAAVAKLIGVPYEPRQMLSPAALVARYDLNLAVGRRFIAQMTPEVLALKLPGRDRPMYGVAYQVAMVARAFLRAYETGHHTTEFYFTPDRVIARNELLTLAADTSRIISRWWEDEGQDDPMDRVVETYWGFPTLHEVLEREVWHTTQHVRQLMFALELCRIVPDGALTAENLAGLPLPENVHA